jgi:hypothetical protein
MIYLPLSRNSLIDVRREKKDGIWAYPVWKSVPP